jgi:ubiquinone/menaquinone biosynthesis C-methylase UbiE
MSKKNNNINILVKKVLKYNNDDISKIISKTDNNIDNIINSIFDISQILINKKILGKTTYVAEKLADLLTNTLNLDNSISIVDIGGGNGDIIKKIGESMNIPNNNLYCIEQKDNWSESYLFDNNIKYIFWDNNNINDIQDSSIDVILIVVALHHMTDDIINNVLKNAYKILKPDGYLIIKEHDSMNCHSTIKLIDWEHHLYHIINQNDLTKETIDNYLNSYLNNYKSKETMTNLILKYNFSEIVELNRFIEPVSNINIDKTNITKLYWKIFQKD